MTEEEYIDQNLILEARPEESQPLDPDRPHWGPSAGIGIWLFSFFALLVMSLLAVLVWYVVESVRGMPLPQTQQELSEWLLSPNSILVQVLSTVVAHVVTIAACWAVVTGMGRRPFLDSLGWKWEGGSTAAKVGYVFGMAVTMWITLIVLSRLLPQSSETQFDQLLKTSQQVRYAVAFMAVFTAPFVEEVVYRGVLFSGLRSRMGLPLTVAFVTLLFAGVHAYQYWGAWAGLIGLTLLSLVLTLMRARTKSIFPCVAVHLVFNAIQAVFIVINPSS